MVQRLMATMTNTDAVTRGHLDGIPRRRAARPRRARGGDRRRGGVPLIRQRELFDDQDVVVDGGAALGA
jgi:hypothetical protein